MKQEKSKKATQRELLEEKYSLLAKELMNRLFIYDEDNEYYVVRKEFTSEQQVEQLFTLYFNNVENAVLRSIIEQNG